MEWKEVRLGDVCSKIGSGATPSGGKEAYKGGDYHLIRSQNVLDFAFSKDGLASINDEQANKLKNVEIIQGDVLLNITGDSVARCCIVPSEILPARVNQHVAIIRPRKEELDNHYLLYYLQHYKRQLLQIASAGATRNAITKAMIENLILPCPKSLDDQRRIASILSSLDRKIELNNKINADLEEMAQAIFKNWFVDFEPFKDGKFVDSELGMIPEGWKAISLNEILDNVSGYSYKGSELQSSNIAMATIKNFERKGGFKTEGYKEIVISKKIKETQFVNMFDVLVAHTDLTQNAEIVGNPAIVLSKGGYEKLIMSMDLTKVISKIDGVTNGLLYCILSTSRFKEHALGYVNGTTVLHMSKKAVPEYTCAFPKDINQIRDLCITLDSIYKRMAVTYDENSRLSTLRDTLLPRLMSGELEVPE